MLTNFYDLIQKSDIPVINKQIKLQSLFLRYKNLMEY